MNRWIETVKPDYINRGFFDIKPGLERIRKNLSYLGIKKNKPIFQVVGTNGKGSTSYILSTLLKQIGVSAGTFTSPHEFSPTERFLINGNQISKEELTNLLKIVKHSETMCGNKLSYFELLTTAALYWFKIKDVDAIVLEAGMGGRWDSTSALGQSVLIITHIDIDHTDYLGKTVAEIANEKVNAASDNSFIISSPQSDTVNNVLSSYAKEKNMPISFIDSKSINIISEDLSGTAFSWKDSKLKTNLLGKNQAVNIAAAFKAVNLVYNYPIKFLEKGIKNLLIPSRIELKRIDKLNVIFDGGHNPDAMRTVSEFLKQIKSKITIVYSSMKDKNYTSNLKILSVLSNDIFIIELPFERSESAFNLMQASKRFFSSVNYLNIDSLCKFIEEKKQIDETILIIGSFYLTGLSKYTLKELPLANP